MPLSIDIAFKWGKKKGEQKPEDDKAKKDGTSSGTTCNTSCSNTTTENAKKSTTSTDTEQFKTVEAELIPPNASTKKEPPKTVDTNDDESSSDASASSTMTNETQKETGADSSGKNEKPKKLDADIVDTATTQSGESVLSSDGKLETVKSEDDGVQSDDEQRQRMMGTAERFKFPRNLIFIRHAERMDYVFPAWIQQSNSNGNYKMYNANQPRQLPRRRGGLKSFELDPPITEIGSIEAHLTGKSIKMAGHSIKAIYSSPALRCVQTAQILLEEIDNPDLKINVEYGLFDLFSFYESCPMFLSYTEMVQAGFSVSRTTKPIMTKEKFVKDFFNETKHDYYRRSREVIHKIISSTIGTVLIVGHASTMDACPRPILELPTSVPANHYLDRLHDRYPYCSSIVLHQDKESKNWHLVDSLLPITFMNQSNKIDKNFMLRK